MKKPQHLRSYLIESIPALTNNPDQLQIFIDTGNLAARLETNLHFEYQYTLNLICTDMGFHPNALIVPLLAWLRTHQPELAADAIKFEADILDTDKIDLSITLPLTERVLVETTTDNNYTATHLDEPQPEWVLPTPAVFRQLFADNALMTPTDE